MVRRREAPPAVRYWHLLSFDAPTVAVVWSLAFAWIAHVRLPLWLITLQALVVWAVYVGDRLLDARSGLRKSDGEDLRERHFFHWRHRSTLAPLAGVAACASAVMVLCWMPPVAKERSSLLGVASLAYFARVHVKRVHEWLARIFSKELLVGVLFTAGCALPVWSRAVAVPVMFFAALAWLNCWAIECWETEPGKCRVARVAGGLSAAGCAVAGCMIAFEPRVAGLLLAAGASAALLAALDMGRGRMTAVAVRALADLVLLTPAAVIAVARMAR